VRFAKFRGNEIAKFHIFSRHVEQYGGVGAIIMGRRQAVKRIADDILGMMSQIIIIITVIGSLS
jgi:hypothetical protein